MKALIIGGGIAGMSTALALNKAGIACEVFEARDSHSDGVGAFLTVAVNGITTLRMLGLDAARVPGIDTPRMRLMLSDAKPLTEFPLGPAVDTARVATGGGGDGAAETARVATGGAAEPARVATGGVAGTARVATGGVAGGGAETARVAAGGGGDGAVETGETVTRTMKRAELYAALRARAGDAGIRVSYAKRLTAAETRAGEVTAHFDDGSSARGDLLIGADGLHSRVRGIIDAHAVKARYLGLLNAGGYLSADALDRGAGNRVGVVNEQADSMSSAGPDVGAIGVTRGNHAASASSAATGAGDVAVAQSGWHAGDAGSTAAAARGRWGEPGVMNMMFGTKVFFSWLDDGEGGAWWFANPPMKREPARGELSAISTAKWRERLLQLVEGDAGPAGTIIRSSDELFAPWPTHDFKRVKVWSRDRMIIIGDAAHAASPSSGQGASMAIEDAAVLAMALRDSGSIEEAFAVYEAERRPRVSRIVAQGKRNGSGKTPGRLGRAMRDAFLRRMFARPPRGSDQRWLYEYPLDWERGL